MPERAFFTIRRIGKPSLFTDEVILEQFHGSWLQLVVQSDIRLHGIEHFK